MSACALCVCVICAVTPGCVSWLCLLITPPLSLALSLALSLSLSLSLSISIVRPCVVRIGAPTFTTFFCAKRAVCEWCALIALCASDAVML